jgi:hypothetical protein
MSVSEVVDFMIENRNVVGQQEARIIKRYDFNDYKGRMKTFFKDLGITDNLTGGLLQVDKVIKK